MARFSARSSLTDLHPRSRPARKHTKRPPSAYARYAHSRKAKRSSRATQSTRSTLSFVYVGNVRLSSNVQPYMLNFWSSSDRMSVTTTLKTYLHSVARLNMFRYAAALASLSPPVPTQTLFMLRSCLLAWREQHGL